MAHMILPADKMRRLIRKRRRLGHDRKDEVWNGVYVMAPDANNEHQRLGTRLASVIDQAIGDDEGVCVVSGGNISDRDDNWTKNYRCPDLQVYLPGNPAEDRETHYYGGPDFAVEIISPGDRSRKKFAFYAKVNVRELILIDRNPWRLELYRLRGGAYAPAEVSDADRPATLTSAVLPVSFRLRPGEPRPRIEVVQTQDGRAWTV